MPIKVKIDVTKIDKQHLFAGKKGKYLDIALIEKPNEYGDDGFVVQEVSKEARDNGEKGPIIGNWRHPKRKEAPSQNPAAQGSGVTEGEDDIPFAPNYL